jgi:glycosyltransferase involved in cell wall biosynthesis
MPKILRIINRFNLGGPTYNAALLTKYLEPNYETLLIGGKEEESEESSQFILDQLDLNPLIISEMQRDIGIKNDREAYKKIKKLIHEFKPDIIHTHASKAGAIGRTAGIAYGKAKMVHTFHGHVFHSYFGKVKTNVYKNIERTLALKTDKIVAISDIQKIELSKKYRICSADRIEVIPLGFDLNKFNESKTDKRINFRKHYNLDEDEIAIGIIGRLVPIKNHKLFINAISKINQRTNKKIRAFIIGDGSEREDLKRFCSSLNLDFLNGDFSGDMKASVHFTSWIKDIDQVNAGMDIIALTSLNEGTPVSLIEAQASGKPIVSTKVGGVSNIVLPNRTALLAENNNCDHFTDQLLKLIENPALRKNMSTLGWEHVKNKFHYTRLVDDIDSLYQKILN